MEFAFFRRSSKQVGLALLMMVTAAVVVGDHPVNAHAANCLTNACGDPDNHRGGGTGGPPPPSGCPLGESGTTSYFWGMRVCLNEADTRGVENLFQDPVFNDACKAGGGAIALKVLETLMTTVPAAGVGGLVVAIGVAAAAAGLCSVGPGLQYADHGNGVGIYFFLWVLPVEVRAT